MEGNAACSPNAVGARWEGATVLLSGGVDSAAALAAIRDQIAEVESVFVAYGQPAVVEERAAAVAIADHYGSLHRELLLEGVGISVGEVPGRNAMLVLTAMIAGEGTGAVVLGIHKGTPYWDCSEEFVVAMQTLLDGYTAGGVRLVAPFSKLGKGDIYRYARARGVPEQLTYSCERAGGPCGACLSCRDVEANARA